MPMFEDISDLGEDGKTAQQGAPSPEPLPATERSSLPSKPIFIPAPATSTYQSRRMSEESIRTELCEGPVSVSPPPLPRPFATQPSPAPSHSYSSSEQHPPCTPLSRDSSGQITDRAELIERIKRGESPTWIPNRHLESFYHAQNSQSPTQSPRPPSANTPTSTNLFPAADITPEQAPLEAQDHDTHVSARLEEGLNIERPRSALHSGDFTESTSTRRQRQHQRRPSDETDARTGTLGAVTARAGLSDSSFQSNTSAPWVATSPPRHYTPFSYDHRAAPTSSLAEIGAFQSSVPSASSSLSTSFVYKAPTSPLVQSQSNDDDDAVDITLPMNNIDIAFRTSPTNSANSFRANSRRHSLTFSHFHHTHSSPHPVPYPPHALSSRYSPAAIRRDGSFPYQAHQPRRSLSTTPNFNADLSASFHATSTPQTPLLSRSRRPSFTLDTSPLQHASMVGSYEESILRGRMSTTPSKPLDFLAQIGVLGLGAKCKPSLRCPAHVTLPFSAVFYSYATTSHGRSKAEDGPSPYVGMIDLENGLPNSNADQRSRRKAMMPSRRTASSTRVSNPQSDAATASIAAGDAQGSGDPNVETSAGEDVIMGEVHVEGPDLSDAEANRSTPDATRSRQRRTHGPKAPPGGSYRIPAQGQLQIIIKNQNKTAVKLFLIPYDLSEMEPGSKTFIRQRSYSAGPIIDNMPASADSTSERPILRYLVHLHICCPSRGRYYLYKSIRVVFANRVPDGKEKLRNELSFPEPRYTPYKPIRVMHPPTGAAGGSGYHHGGGGPGAALAVEKAYRRRSSGFPFAGQGASYGLDAFGIQHHTPVPTVPAMPVVPLRSVSNMQAASTVSPSGQVESDTVASRFPRSSDLSPTPSVADRLLKQTSLGFSAASGKQSSDSKSIGIPTEIGGGSPVFASSIPPLYKKLSKGDIGYGGNAFVSGSPAAYDGLLSQHLRSLEAEKKPPTEEGN